MKIHCLIIEKIKLHKQLANINWLGTQYTLLLLGIFYCMLLDMYIIWIHTIPQTWYEYNIGEKVKRRVAWNNPELTRPRIGDKDNWDWILTWR